MKNLVEFEFPRLQLVVDDALASATDYSKFGLLLHLLGDLDALGLAE